MLSETLTNAKYTIGINTDAPVMFLDSDIGVNEDGTGIDGSVFSRELMELDLLNKKEINIWINSTGGSVIEGQKIYSAILNSKTKVNTYNNGVALSIAAAIFQAGRKRYMMDFAKTMLHPVSATSDTKVLSAFTDSVVTMLGRRVKCSETDLRSMMNQTTWLNADQCEATGLCDEIITSASVNKPRLTNDAVNDYNACKLVMNQAKENFINSNNNIMKKVANHFKLNESATEDSILAEVVNAENKFKTEIDSVKNVLKIETEKTTSLTAEVTELKNKLATTEAENAARVEAENAEKAEALVAKGVKDGKIADTAEAKNKWLELAKIQPKETEELLATVATNKTGAKLIVENIGNNVKNLGAGAKMAAAMQEISNKTKVK